MRKILIYMILIIATVSMAKDTNSTIVIDSNKTIAKLPQKSEATVIEWAKDYQTGIQEAKKLNKPVFFVISRDTCKYCVILKKTTFIDKKVIEALNKDFVSIIAQIDENDYVPRELYAPGLPAMWFLFSDGTPMYQPLMGMMKTDAMLKALAIVKTEFDANKIEEEKKEKKDKAEKKEKKEEKKR